MHRLVVLLIALPFSAMAAQATEIPAPEDVTATLAKMVEEDQRLREIDTIDWNFVVEADKKHRAKVYELLAQGVIVEGEDLFRAALILQHADPGSCRDCYLLAHHLAVQAAEQGYDARYMAAACLDRYLVWSNQPQRYGTQYNQDSTGHWYLFPIDSTTTDEDRAKWDVVPLEQLEAKIRELNGE